MTNNNEFEYAGFWIRVLATLIDSFIIVTITTPILFSIYGSEYLSPPDNEDLFVGFMDFLISFVFPIVAVIFCWNRWQATPGKIAIAAKIVDARTGEKPSIRQYIIRYIAYIPSFFLFGLGVFWVAFDKRKQGWHDKLANTLVIKKTDTVPEEAPLKNISRDDDPDPIQRISN